MPTAPRRVPVVSQPDAVSRRQPIHGIEDMPSGYDAEVAELFRDLRAATALSEMDLAARIGTRPEVVQALEQGALQALPPWAETCRVVNAYGTMLNLDVRPLLRRIYAQLEAGIVELQPKPFPEVPTMTPPDSDDFGFGPGMGAASCAQSPRHSLAAPAAAARPAAEAVLAKRGTGRGASSAAPERRAVSSAAEHEAAAARRTATLAGLAGRTASHAASPAARARAETGASASPARPAAASAASRTASGPAATGRRDRGDLPRPICSRRLSAPVPHNRRRPSLKRSAAALAC